MKKLLWAVLLCAALNGSAQVFWTETFSNSCASGCMASSYSGANGAWTVTSMGANLGSSNVWFVSGAECGNAAGQCGTDCGSSDPSLHIGANIIPFLVDPGAAYYANIESFWRAESPTINCSGKSNISAAFNYIMEGQTGADFATVAYYDGTTWYYYNGSTWSTTFSSMPVSNNAACSPQGLWTSYSVMLPASANNNSNVKIGFRWVNNNDGAGSDPSFAVDDINISASAPTCSASINPIWPAILCHGDCNSALSATASGTGPISYSWNTVPVQTTQSALNLCAGTYTVTITDSTGCQATASATITQPAQLIIDSIVLSNYNGWNISCNGACDGSAIVYASGGTTPYVYLWSSGNTTQSVTGLCAGAYTVVISDANGCTVSASFTLTEPPLLGLVGLATINPSCSGCFDGTMCLGAHGGGTPPYTYSITPIAGNFNGNCWLNLPAGIYTVCITDANGCTVCLADTLVDPPSGMRDNFSSKEIILSPNIISTSAVLTVPFVKEGILFVMYDSFGKKIREELFTGKEMKLEKGNLSPGIYFFELTANQRRFYVGKFIIE